MKNNRILCSVKALALTLIATVASFSAWAQSTVNTGQTQVNLDGNATDGYFINMPALGKATSVGTADVLTLDLSSYTFNNDGSLTFNIYGDNGNAAPFSPRYDGYLVLMAPEDYLIRLSGTMMPSSQYGCYLRLYNGATIETAGSNYTTISATTSSLININTFQSVSNGIIVHFQVYDDEIPQNARLNLTVTVSPKTDLRNAVFDMQAKYIYNGGGAVDVDYAVTLAGNTLVKGTHYNESFVDSNVQPINTVTEVGQYTLTISAVEGSGYTGSKSATFEVVTLDWNLLQEQFNLGKNVKLWNDVTAASSDYRLSIPSGKTVVLDLNGHKIDRNLSSPTNWGSVFFVQGNLTVCDNSTGQPGIITGGNNTGDGGAFYVSYGSTLTFQGGQIKGNHAKNGGGIYTSNEESSKVNIEGGEIINNTASENGGGVYLKGRINLYTMKGAPVIKNNTVNGAPNNLFLAARETYDGMGSTLISNSTVFTISGVLTQNAGGAQIGITCGASGTNAIAIGWSKMGTARPTDYFVADLPSLYTFEAINAGDDTRVFIKGVSHNVYTNVTGSGTVTPSATSVSFGDEVSLEVSYGADFHLESISVKDNNNNPVELRQTDTKIYAFTMPNIDVTVTATFASGAADMTWFDIQHAFDAGQNVTLTNDVTAPAGAARLELKPGKSIILDLNGHILSRGLSSPIKDGQVIYVHGSTLTLTDNEPSATHTGTSLTGGILTGGNNGTGDYDGYGGGIFVEAYYSDNALLIMNSGSIAGNKTTYGGAGVCVQSNNNNKYAGFKMTGGKITDNEATGISGSGGGVFLYDSSRDTYFNMTGGEISNNSAKSGGGITSNTESTLTIDDEEVPALSISGGSIINNTATGTDPEHVVAGGGIFVYKSISLSGAPTISGNTWGGSDNNIYLDRYFEGNGYKPCTINIVGNLTNTTPIGVSVSDDTKPTESVARVITSNLGNYGSVDNFVSDQGYAKCLENGEAAFFIMPSLTLHETKVLGETKYVCTFYHSALAFQLSEGAKAYTVHLDGEGADAAAVFYRIGDDSDIIPADCPVVIISDTSTATLTPTTFTGTKDEDNVLKATTTEKKYLSENGKSPYGLYQSGGSITFIRLVESQYHSYPAGTVYLLK